MSLSRRVTVVVAGLALAVATAGLPAHAAAPGAKAPELRVVGYGSVQSPHYLSSEVSSRPAAARKCVVLAGDGNGSFPGPLLVEPGVEKLRFALHTSAKPTHRSLTVYAIDPRDDPYQEPVHVTTHLIHTKGPGGHPTWVIGSHLTLGAGQPAYLELDVGWTSKGCNTPDSYAWSFHVQAAS